MSGVLLFAFAAAAFGGFNSMLGAVLGGIVVGVSQNLGATYIPAIGHDLGPGRPIPDHSAGAVDPADRLFGRASPVRV